MLLPRVSPLSMEAQDIIDYIASAPKKTLVKVYVREHEGAEVDYGPDSRVFGAGDKIVFGDWAEVGPVLEANAGVIEDYVVEADRRNSGVPLLDTKGVNARIEPGAIIREKVEIGDNAVIMPKVRYRFCIRPDLSLRPSSWRSTWRSSPQAGRDAWSLPCPMPDERGVSLRPSYASGECP